LLISADILSGDYFSVLHAANSASFTLHTAIQSDTNERIVLPKMPDDSAQFAPCGLLIAFPSEGQEIDCKMQSNCSWAYENKAFHHSSD
jgi:hypothetical protein